MAKSRLLKDLRWAWSYLTARNDLPNDFVLAVTYSCNSRCRMCNIWKSEVQPVLALSEYQKLPADMKEINLSGGEPFLRSDLVALVALLVKQNPRVRIIINSNGFATELITAKIKEIIKIKPDIILGFSIDGIGELHDEVRGIPGGFDKVMATFKAVKKLGVKDLRIAYTAGDYNINQMTQVYKLSQELGAEFTMAAVHNAENYFNISDNKITKLPEFKKEFCILINRELATWQPKNWSRAYFVFALYCFLVSHKRLLPNYSGRDNVFIDPLGAVYPSDVSGHQMGNLKDFNSFKELYQSPKAQEAISLEKNNHNWMMCTARSAMKRHVFQVLYWIFKSKLFGVKL
ncbi:MAG: radical SAM protein [Candidatus Parcubacteria bacterium]|nr:radical SAM protein [Candidatus Parcubacteria bacterium]